MMLGKRRPRPPMTRTTSMTEFTLQDLNADQSGSVFQPSDPFTGAGSVQLPPPPRLHRRNSIDSGHTTGDHFLKVCSLCERRLIPGRDIYMYRGDTAFCSLECRQRKINQDESKNKCASVRNQVSATS